MKIIRKDELTNEPRPDGRKVMNYLSFDVNFETKDIGLIKGEIPIGCKEREHIHAKSDVICFYLTDAIVEVNSKEYELKKGDVLILHAGDRHHHLLRNNDIGVIEIKVPNVSDKVYPNENNKSE